ncbi:MAG: hypothetical protein ACOYXM_10955 [Actinomycetota bacterium]
MHQDHMRARWVAAMAVGGALVLSSCATDRELTEPEPVPVTEENLQATLLTEEDLPAAFTASDEPGTPISAETIDEHDCDDALGELEPELAASADFTANGVVLTDTAAWFPGQGAAAEQVYRDVAERCDQVVVDDRGVAIRAGGLDFGVLSDDVLAIRIEVEPETGAIEERDIIVMRQGDLLHVIRLTGPRPSDKALLDGAVRITIGRLGLLYEDTT